MGFWFQRWGYRHSLLIFVGLVLNGFIIELFANHRGLSAPSFSYGMLLMLPLIILSTIICWNSHFKQAKKWLLSKPFNVSLISTIAVLIMISGYIPQRPFVQYPLLDKLGIFYLTKSIPFSILVIVLTVTLLVAVLNRVFPFRVSNIAFLFNHLGILVVVLGATLGSGEVKKIKLYLEKDQAVWEGHLSDRPSVRFAPPFALKLTEFVLEEYPHDLVIINNQNKVIKKCGPLSISNSNQMICNFEGLRINVNKYIPNAFKVKERYVAVSHIGTTPMAEVEIIDKDNVSVKKGIVTQGSNLQDTEFLQINSSYRLAIPVARPKSFMTKGTFYTPEGKTGPFTVAVNAPFKIAGWSLYQFGYDEKMGKWSNSSIIEAVKDPWLPVVYVGIFLMMIGSLFFMFPSSYFLENKR